MPIVLTAAPDDDGRRLDRILRKALRDLPLSAIHRLLRQGRVLVEGEAASAERHIRAGQTITVNDVTPELMRSGFLPRKTPSSTAFHGCAEDDMPVSLPSGVILYEGEGIIILNKPAGIIVHGRGSLEDQVRSYLSPKTSPSLSFKSGPLHRLDKPSSGIIAFSTNLEGARCFSALMRGRKIKKSYLALIMGTIEKEEIWEDELYRDREEKKSYTKPLMAGIKTPAIAMTKKKFARTRVKVLAGNSACSLILAEIETGRTHQIRVQAAARSHPLLGDSKYGGLSLSLVANNFRYNAGGSVKNGVNKDVSSGVKNGGGFYLHSWRMEFSGDTPFPHIITAPVPDNFMGKIKELFGFIPSDIIH